MILRVPASSARAELVVRRSRFIGVGTPVTTVEEAHRAVDAARAEDPEASHVAYAFVLGDEATETAGMSDAGEPRGTAGRPMLDIIRGSSIRDVVVTVTRYFGGVKLGTGGLVRAYGDTARAVLDALPTRPRVSRSRFTITMPYDLHDVLHNQLQLEGVTVESERFDTAVTMELTVDDTIIPIVRATVTDLSRGRVTMDKTVQNE